jgi:hypothetical protein
MRALALDAPLFRDRVVGAAGTGTIGHRGGIAFTKGRTSVELRRFVITLDDSPSLSAKVGDAASTS